MLVAGGLLLLEDVDGVLLEAVLNGGVLSFAAFDTRGLGFGST